MKVKRIIVVMLVAALSLGCFTAMAGAASAEPETKTVSVTRIDLDNGDYWLEEVVEYTDAPVTRATSYKSGYKTSTYVSGGSAIYTVRVDGSFGYNGTSAWATGAAATVTLHTSAATYVTKSSSYSGNSATATGTVQYNGGNRTRSVTLYCDKDGNLS